MFQLGDFILHSGGKSAWKINCDSLTEEDWKCLGVLSMEMLQDFPFGMVFGVPRGGLPLEKILSKYTTKTSNILLVDDVLTTGGSLTDLYKSTQKAFPGRSILGLVAFARGRCPHWVRPIFQLYDKK